MSSRLKIVAALLSATALLATACSNDDGGDNAAEQGPVPSTDYFGYQVNTRLATTNAGTAFGDATGAALLSNRLYPATFVPGPGGQMIPNSDLVETEVISPQNDNDPLKVVYTLSEEANFSDGAPVVCDDYLLAYKAGKLSAQFGSHMPLAKSIEEFHCGTGQKRFMVVFKPDSGDRWRYLFGPGTVMPSHKIAEKAGMNSEELFSALYNEDEAALEPVKQVWRYGFATAKEDFDPELQVSYGPFVIDRIGDSGEVVLKRNNEYYGDAANLEHVVVWPSTANTAELVAQDALQVIDADSQDPEWLDRDAEDNPFELYQEIGVQTETLTLSQAGVFTEDWARRAFAACIDQNRIAEVSSRESGLDVPPVYLRTLRHDDPINAHFESVAKPHQQTEPDKAQQLGGNTVRIGYLGPNERYAAMVEEIRSMCEPFGINVEDQSAEYMSQNYLEMDPATWMPTIDAFLGPVEPLREYSAPEADIANIEDIKKAEEDLWESVPSIPLSAQPRVFVVDKQVTGSVPYTNVSGIGWNMDRWAYPVDTDDN